MHSKEYLNARKEFINCIFMSPFCFFVPLYNAFYEWLPEMKEALRREKEPTAAE